MCIRQGETKFIILNSSIYVSDVNLFFAFFVINRLECRVKSLNVLVMYLYFVSRLLSQFGIYARNNRVTLCPICSLWDALVTLGNFSSRLVTLDHFGSRWVT